MPDQPLPADPQSADRLLHAAIRLATELDRAQLYLAAAYAAMAADAVSAAARQNEQDRGSAPEFAPAFLTRDDD